MKKAIRLSDRFVFCTGDVICVVAVLFRTRDCRGFQSRSSSVSARLRMKS